jgi:hypothetical protein
LDTEKPSSEETAKKFGFEDDFYSGDLSWWQKTKPKIWSMFDEPYSSSPAKGSNFILLKSPFPLNEIFIFTIDFLSTIRTFPGILGNQCI